MIDLNLDDLSPALRTAIETVISAEAGGHGFFGVEDDADMIAIDAEWATASEYLDAVGSSTGGSGYRLTPEARAAFADEIETAREAQRFERA